MFYNLRRTIEALNKTERFLLVAAICVLILSLFFFGILTFYKKTVIAPVEGGRFTEGIVGQPQFINPLIAQNKQDEDIIELTFSDLLDLADKYVSSDDGKVWDINLKPELKWSDNEPLNSDDVVFTIEAIQDPESRSSYSELWRGVIIERISEREIRFTLKTPYVFFADNLKDLKIVPRHIFSGIPMSNLNLSSYNLEPVSSGPYIFKQLQKRKDGFITRIQLEANPNYPGDKPLISEFNFDFFASYPDAGAAFNKKEIDGLGSLDNNDLKEIMIGNQLFELNTARYYAIFFNQTLNPALKETAVREALNYATDKNRIISSVFDGRATPVSGPLLPEISGYDASVYANDIFSFANATSTLDDAKWKLNKDGIWEKVISRNNILKTEFEIIVPDIKFLVDAVNVVKEDWQKIGVKLDSIVMPVNDVKEEVIKPRNYQMIIWGNDLTRNNPDIFAFWHSAAKFYPGENLALYENKKVDGLLESVRKDLDEETRNKALSDLQTIIEGDQPAIFLFSPHYFYVTTKDLGGLDTKFITTPSMRFENVNKWYLKTARVFK